MFNLLYSNDLPKEKETVTNIFAEDTAVLPIGETFKDGIEKFQKNILKFNVWTSK